MRENKTPFFHANVSIHTTRSLEELGQAISESLLGGVPFGGKEDYIREEIPAIYISQILGMRLILMENDSGESYILTFQSLVHGNYGWPSVHLPIDDFMELAVKNALKPYRDIKVIFWKPSE